MKNQKMLIIFPILFLVCALGITFISESYSAADTLVETSATKYYYIRRNMLSHYYVSHNSTESDETRTASGTILIKSGNRYSSSEGSAILVYCAEQGYANSASVHTRKTLSKALKDGNLKTETAKNILNTMMQYSYPFITLSNLKVALKNPT